MKANKNIIILAALLLTTSFSTNSFAYKEEMFYPQEDFSTQEVYWESLGESFREDQYSTSDYFWVIPANVGWTVFTAAGNAIGWPVKIIGNIAMGNIEIETLVPPGKFAGRYFGVPGSYIFGAPFWAMERAFWDYPVSLITGNAINYRKQEPKKDVFPY